MKKGVVIRAQARSTSGKELPLNGGGDWGDDDGGEDGREAVDFSDVRLEAGRVYEENHTTNIATTNVTLSRALSSPVLDDASGRDISKRQSLLLFLLVFGTMAVFLELFTAMGNGADIFRSFYRHFGLVSLFLTISFVDFVSLYLLDASYWKTPKLLMLRRVALVIGGGSLMVAGMFAGKEYPATSMMFFFIGFPIIITIARMSVFRAVRLSHFLRHLSFSLWAMGGSVLIYFLVWIGTEQQMWTRSVKKGYMMTMCPDDMDEPRFKCDADGCGNSCNAAFLIWFAPFLVSCGSLMFGLVLFVLSNIVARPDTKRAAMLGQMLAGSFFLIVFSVWCAASISGAASRMSELVMAGSLMAFLVVCVMICSIVGFQTLKTEMANIPVVKTMSDSWMADYCKALALMMCWPLVPPMLGLSFVNQLLRKSLSCTKNPENGAERALMFTKVISNCGSHILEWNWTSVLSKVVLMGIFYWVMVAGAAKVTVVVLSWLIDCMKDMPLNGVTLMFMMVGVLMFLNPLVPGPPVYITGAVLVTAKAEQSWMGFVGGMLFVSMVCLMVKLVACFIQQKGIGENLAGNVMVRKFVGLNSLEMRGVKKALERPGLSLAKVCILCGMPDWPVSVLCGILKLDIVEILIGTIPVYTLILPMVMTGAFLLKQGDDGYDAIGKVVAGFASMVLMGMSVGSLYYVNRTINQHRDELLAIPPDEEVAALEKAEADIKVLHVELTQWKVLPRTQKWYLGSAALLMSLSMYMIGLVGSRCWRKFELQSDFFAALEEGGLNGSVWNILLRPGWFAVAFFVLSLILNSFFKGFARQAIVNHLMGKDKESSQELSAQQGALQQLQDLQLQVESANQVQEGLQREKQQMVEQVQMMQQTHVQQLQQKDQESQQASMQWQSALQQLQADHAAKEQQWQATVQSLQAQQQMGNTTVEEPSLM